MAAVSAIIGLILAAIARRRRSRPRGAVMFEGHWLFGGIPFMIEAASKQQQCQWHAGLKQTMGRTIIFWAPLMPYCVNTSCPKNIEYILKTNFENYPKGTGFRSKLADLLGTGIFNADGAEWKTQRKVSSHMFTAQLFKEHIWVVVRRNASKLRDILLSSKPNEVVDVFNLMNRFTLDTIGEIGFGKGIGSLEDPSSPFLKSFDRAQQISFWRFVNPLWPLFRALGVHSEKETKEHFRLLDTYSRSVARELCDATDQDSTNGEARKSFVGLFLQDAKKRGEVLTEEYLRDLVLNFLIAGRDTTAQALSWTIFCLAQDKDAEAKARQEILEVCGVRGPTYDDIARLPYVNAVLSEGLRLYPSVPVDFKRSLSDDIWPDGTVVPRGVDVAYDIYSLCRDPAMWGEDADKFRPARWLEMQQPPTSYEFPVFNAGPRECLGKRLAMVEMKTCLAMVLPHVSFELAARPEAITTDNQLTIGMGNGLPCYVTAGICESSHSANTSTTLKSDCDSLHSESSGLLSAPQ